MSHDKDNDRAEKDRLHRLGKTLRDYNSGDGIRLLSSHNETENAKRISAIYEKVKQMAALHPLSGKFNLHANMLIHSAYEAAASNPSSVVPLHFDIEAAPLINYDSIPYSQLMHNNTLGPDSEKGGTHSYTTEWERMINAFRIEPVGPWKSRAEVRHPKSEPPPKQPPSTLMMRLVGKLK